MSNQKSTFNVFMANHVWYGNHKEDKCSICTDVMNTGDFIIQLRCKHYYHIECSQRQATNQYCSNKCYCGQARHPMITPEAFKSLGVNDECKEYFEHVDRFATYLKAIYCMKEGAHRKRSRLITEHSELEKKAKLIRHEMGLLASPGVYTAFEIENERIHIPGERIELDFPLAQPEEDDSEIEGYVHNDRYDRQQREEYVP